MDLYGGLLHQLNKLFILAPAILIATAAPVRADDAQHAMREAGKTTQDFCSPAELAALADSPFEEVARGGALTSRFRPAITCVNRLWRECKKQNPQIADAERCFRQAFDQKAGVTDNRYQTYVSTLIVEFERSVHENLESLGGVDYAKIKGKLDSTKAGAMAAVAALPLYHIDELRKGDRETNTMQGAGYVAHKTKSPEEEKDILRMVLLTDPSKAGETMNKLANAAHDLPDSLASDIRASLARAAGQAPSGADPVVDKREEARRNAMAEIVRLTEKVVDLDRDGRPVDVRTTPEATAAQRRLHELFRQLKFDGDDIMTFAAHYSGQKINKGQYGSNRDVPNFGRVVLAALTEKKGDTFTLPVTTRDTRGGTPPSSPNLNRLVAGEIKKAKDREASGLVDRGPGLVFNPGDNNGPPLAQNPPTTNSNGTNAQGPAAPAPDTLAAAPGPQAPTTPDGSAPVTGAGGGLVGDGGRYARPDTFAVAPLGDNNSRSRRAIRRRDKNIGRVASLPRGNFATGLGILPPKQNPFAKPISPTDLAGAGSPPGAGNEPAAPATGAPAGTGSAPAVGVIGGAAPGAVPAGAVGTGSDSNYFATVLRDAEKRTRELFEARTAGGRSIFDDTANTRREWDRKVAERIKKVLGQGAIALNSVIHDAWKTARGLIERDRTVDEEGNELQVVTLQLDSPPVPRRPIKILKTIKDLPDKITELIQTCPVDLASRVCLRVSENELRIYTKDRDLRSSETTSVYPDPNGNGRVETVTVVTYNHKQPVKAEMTTKTIDAHEKVIGTHTEKLTSPSMVASGASTPKAPETAPKKPVAPGRELASDSAVVRGYFNGLFPNDNERL